MSVAKIEAETTITDKNLTNKMGKSNRKLKKSTTNRGLFANILSNLVGENLELSKYWKTVEKIDALEDGISKLGDQELKDKTPYFRSLVKGLEGKALENKLNELLPEVFAVVREASKRTINKRQYSVQLIGAMVLHDGRIAELKTGEGKTFVAPLAAYLNALPEKSQVHIVTVNDYLARIGASWIGAIFDFLGMSVGVIQPNASFYFKMGYQASEAEEKMREMGRATDLADDGDDKNKNVIDVENLVPCDRNRAYWNDEDNTQVDIVYAVNSELGFDYLRDNMVQTKAEVVQKSGNIMAIVDEVDSILIDEARTPLIISGQDESSSERYRQFSKIVNQLNQELDFTVDEKRKVVTLTELGIEKIERILGIDNLYSDTKNVILIHHLDQALKAKTLFKREKEYVVKGDEIIIVDEFTGRMMYGRRYSEGLHQALESKEGLKVQSESRTVATITYQNFFRLYKKLCGMTGTASTESEELYKIYKLLVVTIPSNSPSNRKDDVDKLFKTEIGKFKNIVLEVQAVHATGQPILIGTTSIEKNLELSRLLNEAGVPHQVLNAKNHAQEARIISSAGKKNAVTLATNIAGRGVDIVLGGVQPDSSDIEAHKTWKIEHMEVKSIGGLFVIGTERHESRRIDNQLRGRSGRQGDNGRSQFFISFDDYILRVFGGDKVAYYAKFLPVAQDEAIQVSQFGWLVEQAQKKIEGQNFDVRKHVTEYDDVVSKQRSVIYTKRRKILFNEGFDWEKELSISIYNEVFRIFNSIRKFSKNKKEKELYDLSVKTAFEDLNSIVSFESMSPEKLEIDFKKLKSNVKNAAKKYYDLVIEELKAKWALYTPENKATMTRFIFLRGIDILWTEHLVSINQLQDSTRLRSLAQKDPLTEFKEEAMSLFQALLKEVDREIAVTIFKMDPELVPAGV